MPSIKADFRSDTVTRPSPAMREAMFSARVGDDVYGDDPSVNALEAWTAAFTGKEAALLCTSGTQSNLVALPLGYHAEVEAFCRETGLSLHLDGARLFNACVKQEVNIKEITRHYDSVSLCISKGLGAPVGSILVGDGDLIKQARRWRKMLGGGMRQAGIIAAGCQYALEHNIPRLAEDHDNALHLAKGLSTLQGVSCDPDAVQTNMVFAELDNAGIADELTGHLARRGIAVRGGKIMRLVTHMDVDRAAVELLVTACAEFPGLRQS